MMGSVLKFLSGLYPLTMINIKLDKANRMVKPLPFFFKHSKSSFYMDSVPIL